MSRYIDSKWKQARHLGFSTSETGDELKRRAYGPGQHEIAPHLADITFESCLAQFAFTEVILFMDAPIGRQVFVHQQHRLGFGGFHNGTNCINPEGRK